MVPSRTLGTFEVPSTKRGGDYMGDKSPKAKDKNKKQDTADKNRKQAMAAAKAAPPSPGAAKKGR
jgi:hypothetical protein